MFDDYSTMEAELLNERPKPAIDKFWEMMTGDEESTIHSEDESFESHASSYDDGDFEEEGKLDKDSRASTFKPDESVIAKLSTAFNALFDGQNGNNSTSLGGSPLTSTDDKSTLVSVEKTTTKNPSFDIATTKSVSFYEALNAKSRGSKKEDKPSTTPLGSKTEKMKLVLPFFGSKNKKVEKPSTQPAVSKNEKVKSTTQFFGSINKKEEKPYAQPMGPKNQRLKNNTQPIRSKKEDKPSTQPVISKNKKVKSTTQFFGFWNNLEEQPSAQPMGLKNQQMKTTIQAVRSKKEENPSAQPTISENEQPKSTALFFGSMNKQEEKPSTQPGDSKVKSTTQYFSPMKKHKEKPSAQPVGPKDEKAKSTTQSVVSMSKKEEKPSTQPMVPKNEKVKSTTQFFGSMNKKEEKPSTLPVGSKNDKLKSTTQFFGSNNKQEEKPSIQPMGSKNEKLKSTTQLFGLCDKIEEKPSIQPVGSKNEKIKSPTQLLGFWNNLEEKPSTQAIVSKNIKRERRTLIDCERKTTQETQVTKKIQETKTTTDSRKTAPTEMAFANFSSEFSVDMSVDQSMEGTLEMSVDSHMDDDSHWSSFHKAKWTKEEMQNNKQKLPTIAESENSNVNKESLWSNFSKTKSTKQVKKGMAKVSASTESENTPYDENPKKQKWQMSSKLFGPIRSKKTQGKSAETKPLLGKKADQPSHATAIPQSDLQIIRLEFKPSVIKETEKTLRTASAHKNNQQGSKAKQQPASNRVETIPLENQPSVFKNFATAKQGDLEVSTRKQHAALQCVETAPKENVQAKNETTKQVPQHKKRKLSSSHIETVVLEKKQATFTPFTGITFDSNPESSKGKQQKMSNRVIPMNKKRQDFKNTETKVELRQEAPPKTKLATKSEWKPETKKTNPPSVLANSKPPRATKSTKSRSRLHGSSEAKKRVRSAISGNGRGHATGPFEYHAREAWEEQHEMQKETVRGCIEASERRRKNGRGYATGPFADYTIEPWLEQSKLQKETVRYRSEISESKEDDCYSFESFEAPSDEVTFEFIELLAQPKTLEKYDRFGMDTPKSGFWSFRNSSNSCYGR